MKLRLSFLLGLCATVVTSLVAQEPGPAAVPTRSPEQLDELLGPIALYPDALVALILPAATFSSDVVLAQRYLVAGADAALLDDQEWDNSVKSLARYPDVMRWMDENLAWTKQVGEAFVVQPDDVMQSIQRLRARARAVGSLTDTPQQVVVVDNSAIRIVPADPEVIYVPYYDPEIVYVERTTYYPDPFLTFGYGFRVGWWLSYDCDWYHRSIWVSDRRRDWVGYREWRHPVFPGNPGYVSRPDRHPWTPPTNSRRFDRDYGNRPRVDVVVRPTPNRDPRAHGSDARFNDSQRQASQPRTNDRTRDSSNSNGTSNANSNRITVPQARENWRPTNNRSRTESASSPGSSTSEVAQPTTTVTTAPATSASPAPSNRNTNGARDRQTRGDRGSYTRTSGDGTTTAPAPRVTATTVPVVTQPQFTAPAAPPPAPAAIVRSNPSSSRENTGYGNNSNRGREVRSAPAPVSQPAPAVTTPPPQRQSYSPRVNYSQPAPQPQPAYVAPQPAAAPAPATTYVAPAQSAPAPQQQPAPAPQQREQRRDGHRQRGGD